MPISELRPGEFIPDHLFLKLLSIDDRISVFPGFGN